MDFEQHNKEQAEIKQGNLQSLYAGLERSSRACSCKWLGFDYVQQLSFSAYPYRQEVDLQFISK